MPSVSFLVLALGLVSTFEPAQAASVGILPGSDSGRSPRNPGGRVNNLNNAGGGGLAGRRCQQLFGEDCQLCTPGFRACEVFQPPVLDEPSLPDDQVGDDEPSLPDDQVGDDEPSLPDDQVGDDEPSF